VLVKFEKLLSVQGGMTSGDIKKRADEKLLQSYGKSDSSVYRKLRQVLSDLVGDRGEVSANKLASFWMWPFFNRESLDPIRRACRRCSSKACCSESGLSPDRKDWSSVANHVESQLVEQSIPAPNNERRPERGCAP
jgi:hypothetical protein